MIDFGAGHSVYERDEDFARVQAVLAPYPNVVLLLPSANLAESVAVLRDRNTPLVGDVPLTRYLVAHPALRALATQVIYTEGKPPAETAAEIRSLARQLPSAS